MLKLFYYENDTYKKLSFEQYTLLFSYFCDSINFPGDIVEVSDFSKAVMSGLCEYYNKSLLFNGINDTNGISFLYVNLKDKDQIQNILDVAIPKMLNNSYICIQNYIMLEDKQKELEDKFRVESKFDFAIIKPQIKLIDDCSRIIKTIEDGASYHILGLGVGDIIISLSEMVRDKCKDVDLIIATLPFAKYPVEFFEVVKSQPYIKRVTYLDSRGLANYIKDHFSPYEFCHPYIEYISRWFNVYFGREVFNCSYNLDSLPMTVEFFTDFHRPLTLPNTAIAWSNNINKILNTNNRKFLILPYSYTTLQPWGWHGWHEFLSSFPGSVPHDKCIFVGLEWETQEYLKSDNILDLVDKIPNVSYLFALAQHVDMVFATQNSLAHYCAGIGKKIYVFEPCVRDFVCHNILNTDTSVTIPYSFDYNKVRKLISAMK